MATIQSKYLRRGFEFEPVQINGDDGNPITIIPHNILFDIIQNQLHNPDRVTYEYRPHLISREHSFVECIMSDRNGRCTREFGESVQGSLKTEIAKTIPGTMAAIRAFDRAAIRFLDFECEGKVYSDNEISTEGMKPVDAAPKKTKQPASDSKTGASSSSKKENKAPASQSGKRKSEASSAAPTFSMAVPLASKCRNAVLDALARYDELIVFDTETTGVKPTDRITEIAAKKFTVDHASGSLKLIDEFQLYLNPEMPLDPEIVELTGLTDEFLEDKPTEKEAFIDIYNFFGDKPQVLSGYNIGFDIRFLSDLYKRQGRELNCGCKLDVCAMAKELITGSVNHKLGTIAGLFGLEGEEFHSASADTDYTVKLFEIFAEEYRKTSSVKTPPASEAAPASAAVPETECTAPDGKLQPSVKSMTLFTPSQAVRRIYVNTDAQTVYYDLVKKKWYSKDGDLSKLDMDYLEKEAWKIADADSQEAFEAFTGKWSAESEQKAA